MLLAPENLAVDVSGTEESIEEDTISTGDFQMGTYTNYIKGQRDKDI
jgi:hypothetical protein